MGRKYKKEQTNVYLELIHFTVQLKLRQYCKATILKKLKICIKDRNGMDLTEAEDIKKKW